MIYTPKITSDIPTVSSSFFYHITILSAFLLSDIAHTSTFSYKFL